MVKMYIWTDLMFRDNIGFIIIPSPSVFLVYSGRVFSVLVNSVRPRTEFNQKIGSV